MSLAETRDRILATMPRSPQREVALQTSVLVPAGEHQLGLVTDHMGSGKTTITIPASRITANAEAEKWLLRIQGRFVGAEAPNRNGAMWSVDDLLHGAPTVAHGPLNWLHNEKKVIGVISDSNFVARATAADGGIQEPHLTADSVIWRWLYPQEAAMTERAATQKALWYSMECISETVECAPTANGPGCGAKFPYVTFMRERAKTCEHLIAKSAPHRLENPIFQGGAIIVPPVRPGWAHAEADVVRQAAAQMDMLNADDFQLEAADMLGMLEVVQAWQA